MKVQLITKANVEFILVILNSLISEDQIVLSSRAVWFFRDGQETIEKIANNNMQSLIDGKICSAMKTGW